MSEPTPVDPATTAERQWWSMLHSCLDITYNNLQRQTRQGELADVIDQTLGVIHAHCVEWDRKHQPELLSCCDVLQDMAAHGAELDPRLCEWVV